MLISSFPPCSEDNAVLSWFIVYRMFLFIISVLLVRASYGLRCGNNQFLTVGSITNTPRCCALCQAGFYMTEPCTSHKTTSCAACENGRFQKEWNNATRCNVCKPQCNSGQIMTVNCTHTSDRQCKCPVDKYWDGGSLYCHKCRQCSLVERETQSCTHSQNRKCEKCHKDTYVDRNLCLPCDRCREGEVVVSECGSGINVKCKSLETGPAIHTSEPPSTVIQVTNTRNFSTSQGVRTSPNVVHDSRNTNWFGVSPDWLIVGGVSFVIFLLLIVGLGIWCRRRQMRMDTKQPSDGYDTSTEDIDQNGMKRNVYVTQGSIQKKPETKVFDNGVRWRDIPGCYVDEIGAVLNPQSLSDWSVLAGRLEYTPQQISNFRLDPTRATQAMLVDWGTSNTATVFKLYKTLKGMRRDDAADKLLPLLMDPLHSIV